MSHDFILLYRPAIKKLYDLCFHSFYLNYFLYIDLHLRLEINFACVLILITTEK